MMDRVAGVHYDIGVFTNLSPDHIGPGEHKTFEEYRSWKGQLFRRCDVGVVNIDDENTEALLEGHTCKLVTYGRSEKADYRAEGCELLRTHDFLGVAFHVSGRDNMDVRVNMPGEFSVYNALAALAVGKVLGLPDAAIHEGLGKCVVKGRVELVPISKKFTILLDYAHNEVSTESLLTTLRAYHPHRLVVVFGCGTGNPFFSTDTTTALRAVEVSADIMFKATMVDGVYDKDPHKYPDAKKYDTLTFTKVLEDRLAVMDGTAATLCRDNKLPILVFDLADPDNIAKAVQGENVGTLVYEG